MIYEIFDERPEIKASHRGQSKHVKTLEHVPADLSLREVVSRFGIADHLTVYRKSDHGYDLVRVAAR